MKIIFFGTPEIAAPCLNAVINSRHEVICVVTRKDKPAGRKKTVLPTPVKKTAMAHNIPVLQPEKPRGPDFISEYKKYPAGLNLIMAYGGILPPEVIYHPLRDSVNIHASLLPKYRGAAPINAAIINGDSETGITYQFINEQLDAGDIIYSEKIKIEQEDNSATLAEKIAGLAAKTSVTVLDMIEKGGCKRIPQDESKASYVKQLKKEDGKIYFNKTSREIINLVRGLLPWPAAFCYLGGKQLKVYRASEYEYNGPEKPGTIVEIIKNKGPVVKTKDSAVILEKVQYEGGKKMDGYSFTLGHKNLKESILN